MMRSLSRSFCPGYVFIFPMATAIVIPSLSEQAAITSLSHGARVSAVY